MSRVATELCANCDTAPARPDWTFCEPCLIAYFQQMRPHSPALLAHYASSRRAMLTCVYELRQRAAGLDLQPIGEERWKGHNLLSVAQRAQTAGDAVRRPRLYADADRLYQLFCYHATAHDVEECDASLYEVVGFKGLSPARQALYTPAACPLIRMAAQSE